MGHHHDPRPQRGGQSRNRTRTFWAAVITGGFMVAEVAGGIISGSLALIADAAHMLTDAVSLGFAWFALADQPSLGAADIGALLAAYQGSDQEQIMMPVFDGQRGNPIIVPRAIIEAIGQGPVNFGCRKFIDDNPSRIIRYEAQNDHFTRDVDTVEVLAAYAG